MNTYKVMLSFGGGLGDVLWDFLNDRRSWWLKGLVEGYGARIRVITQCHNSGIEDLFRNHPYIHEHIVEAWQPPSTEATQRLRNPIDGYIPICRDDLLQAHGIYPGAPDKPQLYLARAEVEQLQRLLSRRPLICAQPFAGLSDRDAFDSQSFYRLVGEIVHLNPDTHIVVLGKNHDRGCKYAREELNFEHPNVTNLIDKTGIRFNYFLVANCDAYVGSHSNLIRTAWDFRKRNACVMPSPMMEDHIPHLDGKYTYGWKYPESRKFFFPFESAENRGFDRIDYSGLAQFLIRG